MHSHLKLCAETATTGDEIPFACIAAVGLLNLPALALVPVLTSAIAGCPDWGNV